MSEKIPFKKDIIFKTIIGEITDITLNHDYLVKTDVVEGVFYLSGKYKMTEASVIEEEFFYNIPFSIAISDRIDKNTINLTLDSFDYKFNKDVLTLNLNLNMEFDNIPEETMNFERGEEENMAEERKEKINDEVETEFQDDITVNENKVEDSVLEDVNIVNEENIITSKETNNILDFTKNNIGDNYTTYKIAMMREENTIENIMAKYNVTIEDLKTLNDIENLKVGDKIIIPIIKNEF